MRARWGLSWQGSGLLSLRRPCTLMPCAFHACRKFLLPDIPMNSTFRLFVLLNGFFLPCAVASSQQPVVSLDRIRADVKYLASAPLQGRGVGSRGEELATAYIAQQFEKA